jgi:peptidoglycan/LPS O-acetylase OafA/YrhL
VLVFVLAGRRSHSEGAAVAGTAATAWPFLAGLGAGWCATRAWRAPLRPVRTGLAVAVIAVVVGMVLRVVVGQGTAVAFVLVATAVLGALLTGWRAAVQAYAQHRARRALSPEETP